MFMALMHNNFWQLVCGVLSGVELLFNLILNFVITVLFLVFILFSEAKTSVPGKSNNLGEFEFQ